jgi:hypothetical protein
VVIDRRAGSWKEEKITWLLDGTPFHSITGATLNDEGTWGTLAHSPMYVLLNVAVGGNWPVSITLLLCTWMTRALIRSLRVTPTRPLKLATRT